MKKIGAIGRPQMLPKAVQAKKHTKSNTPTRMTNRCGLVLIFVCLLFSMACSLRRVDLLQTGKYTVEEVVPEGYIASAFASEMDGSLIVSGEITHKFFNLHSRHSRHLISLRRTRQYKRGFVEVKLVNADGMLVDTKTTEYKPPSTRRAQRTSTFTIRFTPPPRDGTKFIFRHNFEKKQSN